jgi:hypothetical protein
MEKKKNTTIEDLCAGLPKQFAEYMRTVRQLHHGEMPDYAKMRELFRQPGQRQGQEDDVFDWVMLLFLQLKEGTQA